LGIDIEDYIPAIHLYFNDDLTIAWIEEFKIFLIHFEI
jgi:L-rhamnose isomerase